MASLLAFMASLLAFILYACAASLRGLAVAAIAAAAPFAADLLFALGLGAMSFGFWLAWEPLGWIVFGATICLPMLIHRMRGTQESVALNDRTRG